MNTEEGNKLIAEFMGKTHHPKLEATSFINDLHYHDDYRWIMNIVDKIRKDFDVTIQLMDGDCNMFFNRKDVDETDFTSTGGYTNIIEGIWEGVVQFIKEYNYRYPLKHTDVLLSQLKKNK